MLIRNEFNGYSGDGRRTYFKGGDGGAGEARRQEEERQARINSAVRRINDIFDSKPIRNGVNVATSIDRNKTYYDAQGNQINIPNQPRLGNDIVGVDHKLGLLPPETQYNVGAKEYDLGALDKMFRDGQLFTGVQETAPAKTRDQLYAEQKQAVFDINARDVNKQYQEAERQNRFGLARAGLMGGSADVDSNAQLQERTNEGLMKATGIADQAASDLKTADERSRQSLISMAQSGIDTGTAQGMALRNLDATAQSAQAQRQGATIGGLFNDLSQAYLMRQAANGQRAGAAPWQQQGYVVSTPQQTYGGSTQR